MPRSSSDLVLARVGDHSITMRDLRAFYEHMPESLQNETEGIEQVRDHLATLIDMQLLRREALERGVESTPAYLAKTLGYERDRMVGFYIRDKIKVSLSAEDVRAHFAEQALGRRVRFGQIVTGSLDSARMAIRDIGSGKTFEEAARLWSIHDLTSRNSGDTGRYVSKGDLPPDMADALFTLAVGELSEPIDLGGAYGIFTAIDEFEGEPDDEASASAYRQLYSERSLGQRLATVDSLARTYGLELDRVGLRALLAALSADDLSAASAVRRIFSYDGGEITGTEALESIDPLVRKDLVRRGEEAAAAHLRQGVVADELLLGAAHSEGYAEHPDIKPWLAKKRDEQLMVQLRVQVLEERLAITEGEVRSEYEENPDRYRRPVHIEIQEVLLESEVEATELLQKLRAGAKIRDHVGRTLRSEEKRDSAGRMTLTLADATRGHGRLAIKAYLAKEGELGGPVHVPGGYSVFQVLSRHSEPSTFAEAERRARATVRWIRKNQVFEDYLDELRNKYADIVSLDEENLRVAAAE